MTDKQYVKFLERMSVAGWAIAIILGCAVAYIEVKYF